VQLIKTLASLEHLRTWLAVDQPIDARPEESTRLDFKEVLPNDIGKDVAAMANTYGGLILIGISCEEAHTAKKLKRNVPTAIRGARFNGGEAKLQVTQKILASVRPGPQFDVQAIPLEEDGKFVIAIWVQEGIYPPYEYDSRAESSIPVRAQDSSRRANLQEIEAMFAKRSLLQGVAFSQSVSGLAGFFVRDLDADCKARNHFSVTLTPRVSLPVRLDNPSEHRFRTAVSDAFLDSARGSEVTIRTGRQCQVELRRSVNDKTRHHRVWVMSSGGAMGYATNLGSTVRVGDLASDLLSFTRLCGILWGDQGYYGGSRFQVEMACPDSDFLPEFPAGLDSGGDYDVVPGVSFPDSKSPYNSSEVSYGVDVDVSELSSDEHIAAILLYLLRQARGARISFQPLCDAVAGTAASLRSRWQ
jgi:hypothetical protein